MSTRLEVQSAILHGRGSANEQLPKDEIRNLSKWLQEYIDEKSDRQIETDVRSGSGLHDSFEAAAILAQALEEKKAALPWWEKIAGTFAENSAYDEAMKLGREYRESDRTTAVDTVAE